jgi:transposase
VVLEAMNREEQRVRVTTAFNKMLGIVGASVASVAFTPEGVVVGLRRRKRRKLVCPCGWKTWAAYDRSVRRWRHLDLGAVRLFLEAEIRRLDCRRCGRVRTEAVPWARPGARHTRDLQDVVAWLAQRTDKTTITKLLRVSWEAAGSPPSSSSVSGSERTCPASELVSLRPAGHGGRPRGPRAGPCLYHLLALR